MNAAVATVNFSPLFFRGSCDVPALTEASKPLFKNKGLLQPDRSLFDLSFLLFPFSDGMDFSCLEEKFYHYHSLSAKSSNSGVSRIFCFLNFNPNRSILL